MEKYHYTYNQYKKDISNIIKILKSIENPHLVAIYRGSLPIVTHLSNILDLPMSIVKFQSYGNKNDKEVQMLYNAGIKENQTFVIIDDIYDSGKTMKLCIEYFKQFEGKIQPITIFGKQNINQVIYFRENPGIWVEFFWEI